VMFLVKTPKSIQRQTKAMISQWFPLRSWRMISNTLHFFSCVLNKMWHMKMESWLKAKWGTNINIRVDIPCRHMSQLLRQRCLSKPCCYLRWIPKFLIELQDKSHFYIANDPQRRLIWHSQWETKVSCSPKHQCGPTFQPSQWKTTYNKV
jgi:hypothetical protein